MRSTELAWAAGLIDGEGCICITKHPASQYRKVKNDRYVPLLKVTMCHEATLDRLEQIFAIGSRSVHRKMPKASDSYTWLCNAKQMAPVLKLVLPYLVTKKDEAIVALSYLTLPPAPRGGRGGGQTTPGLLLEQREKLYWKLRELKSRFKFRLQGKKPGRKPKKE